MRRLARCAPLAPRWRHVWFLLTLGATFLHPASAPVVLLDLGWTLRSGDWMVHQGQLLTIDPFTSAPAVANQVNVQWLAQLVTYGLYTLGGLPLVITANALVVTLAYGLVLAASVSASGHPRLACLAVAAGYAVGITNLTPRPQTLAYVLFALFLLVLLRAGKGGPGRSLWLLPPAMAVWANVHGSFFLGWLLLGCAACGAAIEGRSLRPARPFVLTLLGCLGAACLTPYGPGSLSYLVTIVGNPIIRGLALEWGPTSVSRPEGLLFFASVIALAVVVVRAPTRLRPTEALLLLVFGCLGLTAVRSVVWWGMAAAPVAARLLATLRRPAVEPTRERPALNLAVMGLASGLVVASLPWAKQANPLVPAAHREVVVQEVPQDLVHFLQAHTYEGRMLTRVGWGGYFDWTLWPAHRPFLDGRFELHPPEVWLDYLAMMFPRADWQALTDRYGVGYMVLSKQDEAGLIDAARATPIWRVDYEDNHAVVFVRSVASQQLVVHSQGSTED
jgi:hypothetical protein